MDINIEASYSLVERAIQAGNISECELLLRAAARLNSEIVHLVPELLTQYKEQAIKNLYNERMEQK